MSQKRLTVLDPLRLTHMTGFDGSYLRSGAETDFGGNGP